MTCTNDQKKYLSDLILKWRDRLNLRHWRLAVDWERPACDGTVLEIQCHEGLQSATIYVGTFFDCDEAAQENAVCHELLHALMQPLWDHIETTLDGLSGQAHDLMRKMLRDDSERLTDALAQILAPTVK